VERLLPLLEEAWTQAAGNEPEPRVPNWDDVAAIATTYGPGLAGCLLVGIEGAKGLAYARNKPLVGVNHLVGHLWSVFLRSRDGRPLASVTRGNQTVDLEEFTAPFVGLIVSGGHSTLALARSPNEIETLGQTLDDAAGEAYDKVAKLLGLGYPGGPIVDRLAREWIPADGEEDWPLPIPLKGKASMAFSFSGLKTAVARLVEKRGGPEAITASPQRARGLCAAFQARAVGLRVSRAVQAMKQTGVGRLAVTGGVACNQGLREAIRERAAGREWLVAIPPPSLCTDNAAMIAAVGRHLFESGKTSDLDLNAQPSLSLPCRAPAPA
jgi:N6-L-threonylcarbamoyladenine synthase